MLRIGLKNKGCVSEPALPFRLKRSSQRNRRCFPAVLWVCRDGRLLCWLACFWSERLLFFFPPLHWVSLRQHQIPACRAAASPPRAAQHTQSLSTRFIPLMQPGPRSDLRPRSSSSSACVCLSFAVCLHFTLLFFVIDACWDVISFTLTWFSSRNTDLERLERGSSLFKAAVCPSLLEQI